MPGGAQPARQRSAGELSHCDGMLVAMIFVRPLPRRPLDFQRNEVHERAEKEIHECRYHVVGHPPASSWWGSCSCCLGSAPAAQDLLLRGALLLRVPRDYSNVPGCSREDHGVPRAVAPSSVSSITVGPDGALWFIESDGSVATQIGRITTSGHLTEFPLSLGSNLGGITPGPDGALWFTEQDKNQIGRITTSGQISEFPLLADSSMPIGITTGPDGALWFTESVANQFGASQIGRITMGGQVSEFPLPIALSGTLSGLSDIASGPDGALWFNGTDGIGRITTSGQISEYILPTIQSRPAGLAVGSDGASGSPSRGPIRLDASPRAARSPNSRSPRR